MKHSTLKKSIVLSIGGVLLLGSGYWIGSFVTTNKYEAFLDSITLKRQDDSAYPLVHPILGINSNNAASLEFQPLAQEVRGIFSANTSVLSRYSVYFKDENSGLWFGINENDTYNPASMLKVALAIAAYKEAEADPSFLYREEVYTPELAQLNTNVPFSLPSELQVNQSYTVDDLIEKMIVDSDNGAKNILGNIVDPKVIQDVYTNLSITAPTDGENYTISAKQYTAFFKTLYNVTYLNQDYSNQLLSLLSKATFNKGLVAGVPNTIPVAHKYGEFVNDANNTPTSMELHDCGIVYLPKNPYVLCIMTEGTNEADLSSVISQVSKVIYNEVNNDYK